MPGPSASAPRTSTSSTAARARTRCRETPSRRLGTGGRHGASRRLFTFCGSYAIDAACLTPNAHREDYLGLVEVVTRPGFEQVLFVEMGWGADQHGRNATKACVRAARNAIEFSTVWKSTSELGYPENCGESPP